MRWNSCAALLQFVNLAIKMKNPNFYVLTGGPGSGKTTVLNLLKSRGLATVPEAARVIIKNQMETDGDAVPWGNTVRYSHLMLLHSIVDFEEFFHLQTPIFFDRGIIDALGYARLIEIPITSEMIEAANKYRYNVKVFLFPFWQEIYAKDSERKQDVDEAKRTFFALKKEYEKFGYKTVEVPFLTPQERAQWLLNNL